MAAPKGNQGIYKITSPTGRVYIGQSLDIKVRFAKYRLMHCQGQVRLYNSFVRHGLESHAFDVLEICSEALMNKRERHYQDLYDVLGPGGLNCKLTQTGEAKGRHSAETRAKIAKSHTGKRHSEETLAKLRGRIVSEETRAILRSQNIGRRASDSTREKHRLRMIGNTNTKGLTPPNARKVICRETGLVFSKISEAADHLGVKMSTLKAMLRGEIKNRSSMRYA